MGILLIEDETRIRAFIARGLGAEGFIVDERDDGQLGLLRALDEEYDLSSRGRAWKWHSR